MKGNPVRDHSLYQLSDALKDFLAIPLLILLAFVGLSFVLHALDKSTPAWLLPLKRSIGQYIFKSSDATGTFLEVVAGGLFTQASIIISMLLLTLQQTATSMGNMIYDQFLHRYRNQFYTGYIVGSLMMVILLKTTIDQDFNPVLSAGVALLVTFFALVLLVWFLYSIIEQMRPEMVIDTIRERTIRARRQQRKFLARTRASSRIDHPVQAVLTLERTGFLTQIDWKKLEKCLVGCGAEVEVIFRANVGDYIASRTPVLEVKALEPHEARQLAGRLGAALTVEKVRTVRQDADYGLKQLEMIAWTDSSTARHNPEVGLLAVNALRDLLSRWAREMPEGKKEDGLLPVVYAEDSAAEVLNVYESLFVVAAESQQHQIAAALASSLAAGYPHLSPTLQSHADRVVCCAIATLRKQTFTHELAVALADLVAALQDAERAGTAAALRSAREELAASLGHLKH
ncbi:MAG: DUF2254 family protein [Chloroflexota bacterium]